MSLFAFFIFLFVVVPYVTRRLFAIRYPLTAADLRWVWKTGTRWFSLQRRTGVRGVWITIDTPLSPEASAADSYLRDQLPRMATILNERHETGKSRVVMAETKD